MNDVWTSAGMWMLQTAVGGGLVLLLTCLAMRCTRQPARRQRLGECGLIAAVLVALGSALGPSWLVIAWSAAPRSLALTDQFVADIHDDTFLERMVASPLQDGQALAALDRLDVTALNQDRSHATATSSWTSLAGVGLVIALTVAGAFFALRLLVGYLALLRLMLRSESASDEIRGLFQSMAAGSRWLRLLVSRRLFVPLSCGLWRPTVVLPSAMCEQPAPRQLRWIFRHELTHLRRRDAWSTLLLNVGQILFFALPWYWWLRRQVRLCQEFIADAAAAEQDQDSVDYAEFLVSLASAPAVPVGACAVFGKGSDLTRRVTMLLNDSMCVEKRCPRRWSVAAAIAFAAVAVFLSGIGFRAEAAPDEQVVIIIRPQSGQDQTGKVPEIRILVPSTVAPKFEKMADHQRFELMYDPKFVLSLPEKLVLDKMTDHLYVADKLIVQDVLTWVVQPGNDLTPLRDALKELEKLEKEGKLTKEAIQEAVNKALQQMKSALREVPGIVTLSQKATMEDLKELMLQQKLNEQKAKDQLKLRYKVLDEQRKLDEQKAKDEIKLGWRAQSLKLKTLDEQRKLDEQKAKDQLKRRQEQQQRAFEQLQARRLPVGIKLEAIRPALAQQLKLPKDVGVRVTEVSPISPFAKAGVKADDILYKIAGGMVPGSVKEFSVFVNSLKTGVPLEVVVLRKGKMETAGSITLSESKGIWLPRVTDTKKREGLPLLRIDDSMIIDKGKLEFSPLPTVDLPLTKTIDLIPTKSKDDATGDPGKVE